MQSVYQAENGIEAHMIKDLLAQEGVNAEIKGEYLQGGVGEIQAMGIVSVWVSDPDLYSARQVISQWESNASAYDNQKTLVGGFWPGLLVGLVLGIAATLLMLSFVLA